MTTQHITNIKIENFKCFKALSIAEFKNINLIGGKNNVGKTSLLEAIELSSGCKNTISIRTVDEHKISLLYEALIDLNKESFLNESLAIFDENLLSIKRENEGAIKVQKKDKQLPVLLSSLGDGVNRYVAILCAIWASENSILFIDEIENSIHYSNYPKLWRLIFKTSKEANCQIFATSHSKECIEAFNNYQLNGKDKNGLYFELFRSKKTKSIKASLRNPEQLYYALTHGEEIRG